ncbi:MAG: lipoprotein [Magnetococcales bacterium]|nr:lipoprotein [Magnetococcales bacterium]
MEFRATLAVLLVSTGLILAGCGYKGDLYLPGQEVEKSRNAGATDKKP